MRIVVLDAYTLNPGDLSWNKLSELGECTVYDRSSPEEVISRATDAEIVLVNKVGLDKETLDNLPKLRYIGVLATGYNVVDVEAARARGITVTNVPAYGTPSVAQMTFALLLELTQNTGHHARTVREGQWAASPDFCYWNTPLIELDGLTMGIIGYGSIGRAVGDLARAFGMRVLAYKRRPPDSLPEGVAMAGMDTLFRESDVISLHCPLTAENKHMVDAGRLATMKNSAFLINTARGPLIDEEALAQALNDGEIAGAGLDVLSQEPPPLEHPLYNAKNCIITPHIAWATQAARARLLDIAVANVQAFLEGRPRNVVN